MAAPNPTTNGNNTCTTCTTRNVDARAPNKASAVTCPRRSMARSATDTTNAATPITSPSTIPTTSRLRITVN